ncbi:MAG: hypothetical protein K2J81_10400 [Treponemataceae bacterium]|nr:hypothetical protein [Treponemataceae bacterium]
MIYFIKTIKLIAETVTAISAAIIVLERLLKIIPKSIREFFTEVVPAFFCGFTTATRKKTRFFQAIKAYKDQQKQFQNIVKALAPDSDTEEIFVLNTSELIKFLSESTVFTKITRRKQ